MQRIPTFQLGRVQEPVVVAAACMAVSVVEAAVGEVAGTEIGTEVVSVTRVVAAKVAAVGKEGWKSIESENNAHSLEEVGAVGRKAVCVASTAGGS